LTAPDKALPVVMRETVAGVAGGLAIKVRRPPGPIASVVVAEIQGAPQVVATPRILTRTRPKEQRDARMKWWREARFGMFVHWGRLFRAGRHLQGQARRRHRRVDHVQRQDPVAEYREFAKQFNPVKYNADDWVRAAKEAGMKYIVITSKHHDGFAMFGH